MDVTKTRACNDPHSGYRPKGASRTRQMLRLLAAMSLAALAPVAGHATRPAYWDFAWLMNVATLCRAQSDAYDDSSLARMFPLNRELERRPGAKECLRSIEAMPAYVCTEVMSFNLEKTEAEGRALREKYELETIEHEDALTYLDPLNTSGSPVPRTCPVRAAGIAATSVRPLDQGIAACRSDAGRIRSSKVTIEDEFRTPLETMTQRAEAGDADAQNILGVRYGTGFGPRKDAVASATWYRRAADQGLAIAQANLAYMYLKGEGVEVDFKESFRWAKLAADQGHPRGQMHLAYMFVEGKGVARDAQQAEQCFGLAATQGDLRAQESLVRMYARGDGVPADRARAAMWLQRVREARRTGKSWREE